MIINFLGKEDVFFKFNSSSLTICNTYSLNASSCRGTQLGSNYTRINNTGMTPLFTELQTTARELYDRISAQSLLETFPYWIW